MKRVEKRSLSNSLTAYWSAQSWFAGAGPVGIPPCVGPPRTQPYPPSDHPAESYFFPERGLHRPRHLMEVVTGERWVGYPVDEWNFPFSFRNCWISFSSNLFSSCPFVRRIVRPHPVKFNIYFESGNFSSEGGNEYRCHDEAINIAYWSPQASIYWSPHDETIQNPVTQRGGGGGEGLTQFERSNVRMWFSIKC